MDDGDVLLQGIFNVHNKGTGGRECGTTIRERAIMNLEAFTYAIDRINEDTSILPNLKLSGVALDGCTNPSRAVRQTSMVLNGDIKVDTGSKENTPLIGVLGAGDSDSSIEVAKLMALYRRTQISYSSSTPLLSDNYKYPYFLRTVGSDVSQSRAIIDIIKKMNWTYVSAIFSDNAYGRASMRQFLKMAKANNICVATQVKMESYFAEQRETMHNIVWYLIAGVFRDSNVVVTFLSESDARALLEAKKKILGNTTNRIVWLAADAWGNRESVVRNMEKIARGAVTLDFHSSMAKDFVDYVKTLNPENNQRNVWFKEYWQQTFQCNFPGSDVYNKTCADNLALSDDVHSLQTDVSHVIDSVYIFAHGLQNLLKDTCPQSPTKLCRNATQNLDKLYLYVRDIQIEGVSDTAIQFDLLGDGRPHYDIFNYQKLGEGTYGYAKVSCAMTHGL